MKTEDRAAQDALVNFFIKTPVDWRSVLDDAVKEGVFYPVYQRLLILDARKKIIPDGLRERFRQLHYLHISKSAEFSYSIDRVLDHIESLGIKVLLFKGPATDTFIYDGFLRPRLDMDMAVRSENSHALEEALSDLGYRGAATDPDYPLPEYINSRLFMSGADDMVPVDVHEHLINNSFLTVDGTPPVDMDKIWGETEPFKGYRHICMLKPEMNIIYLCEHAVKHGLDQIVFLYEIDRLISHYNARFNWKKFLALVQDIGLGRVVYYGLYFTKSILSARIPDDIVNELKPTRFTRGEKIFINRTLARDTDRYSSFPVYLAMRRGPIKKINFIFRTIFPPGFTIKGYAMRLGRSILP